MFIYEKKLQFPVKIATPNPKLAAFIISQYGGPDGELGASMRYLSQRYAMPFKMAKGIAVLNLVLLFFYCCPKPYFLRRERSLFTFYLIYFQYYPIIMYR